jgi:hypothetical protein
MSSENAYFDLAKNDCSQNELQQNSHNALVLTCSEPQSTNLALLPAGIGSVRVVKTDGGFAGLNGQADASNHWLVEYLRGYAELDLLVVCAHNDCCFFPSTGLMPTEVANSPVERCSLKHLESLVRKEIRMLRALVSSIGFPQEPIVMGCIYDRDFDWLAIHDDDTHLFLPTNACSIRVE